MQCAAVLLLEAGYQNQHTQDNNSEITSDIQKLIVWLHAMGQNDPCADRAYGVLQRILNDVAPFLRSKAKELLTAGAASKDLAEQAHDSFAPPFSQQGTSSDWAQGELFNGSDQLTGHMYYPQTSEQTYQDTSFPLAGWSTYDSMPFDNMRMPNVFGNPFINNWDEAMPLSSLQNLLPNGRSFAPDGQAAAGDMLLPLGMDVQGQQQQQQQRHQQQPQQQQQQQEHQRRLSEAAVRQLSETTQTIDPQWRSD